MTGWLGDWWAFGNHAYGDRKELVESDEWDGPAYQTCAMASKVCRAFEIGRRLPNVSSSLHQESAFLPIEEADKILFWCDETLSQTGRLPTIKATRQKVKDIKAWLAQGWTTSQLERREAVEQGITVVASMRDNVDSALLAWADQHGHHTRIDRNTVWGNPFEIDADGNRDEVCDKYADHYLPYKNRLMANIGKLKLKLKGKVLVCWCHPERCHGDHLAELANDS